MKFLKIVLILQCLSGTCFSTLQAASEESSTKEKRPSQIMYETLMQAWTQENWDLVLHKYLMKDANEETYLAIDYKRLESMRAQIVDPEFKRFFNLCYLKLVQRLGELLETQKESSIPSVVELSSSFDSIDLSKLGDSTLALVSDDDLTTADSFSFSSDEVSKTEEATTPVLSGLALLVIADLSEIVSSSDETDAPDRRSSNSFSVDIADLNLSDILPPESTCNDSFDQSPLDLSLESALLPDENSCDASFLNTSREPHQKGPKKQLQSTFESANKENKNALREIFAKAKEENLQFQKIREAVGRGHVCIRRGSGT